MYNYRTFLKQRNLQKQIQILQKDNELIQIKRQNSSPALALAHQKRTEGFVLSVIEKPIAATQYKNELHSFRNTNRQGILGSKGFYLRRQTQTQRIKNQIKKNEQLDSIPFTNSHSYRFRQTVGGGMHYKSFTHNFRIKQYLDSQPLNYLINTTSKPEKIIKKHRSGEKVDLFKLNTSINKKLLPILHRKTYFKSVSKLFSEIPSQMESNQIEVSHEEVMEQAQLQRTLKPIEHFSRKQSSKDEQIKCSILRQKLRG